MVEKIAYTYGNQCIICSIDYKIEDGSINIYTSNKFKLDISLEETIQNAFNLGAGEIYLTCINKDGTGQGLDITISSVYQIIRIFNNNIWWYRYARAYGSRLECGM